MDWDQRGVLITGGSKGLGAALARELAARGAHVVVTARHREPLQQVVEEIRGSGGTAFALVYDMARKEDIHALAGATAALVGPVEVLIHNASSLGSVPMPLLLDTACEAFASVLETNVVGPLRLTKLIMGPMLLRKSGTVLFVSSDAAVEAYPRWGSYGVSKAAADHLARVLASENVDSGVRVFSVDPGEMDTDMHAQAMPDADRATLQPPAAVARRLMTLLEHPPQAWRVLASEVRS